MRTFDLDEIIKKSLETFCIEVLPSNWFGREHEWVSHYLLGYLQKQCSETGLRLSQIGLDVAVRQIKEPKPCQKGKPGRDVQKDLVIWPRPAMTLWNEKAEIVNEPIAVMEWKVVHPLNCKGNAKPRKLLQEHDYDRFWLERTAHRIGDEFAGYAVRVDAKSSPRRLCCWRVIEVRSTVTWSEFVDSSKLADQRCV